MLRDIFHKREVKPLQEREYNVSYVCSKTGETKRVKEKGFNVHDAKHRVAIKHQPKKVLTAL